MSDTMDVAVCADIKARPLSADDKRQLTELRAIEAEARAEWQWNRACDALREINVILGHIKQ